MKNHQLNRPLLLIAAIALITCIGCQPDDLPSGRISLHAEPLSAATKQAVNGNSASWVAGDLLLINNQEAAIQVNGNSAYIESTSATLPYRAVYPASIAPAAITSNQVTLSLPSAYHYRTQTDGTQLIDLPMAAYSESSNALHFKHLTGALAVTITNQISRSLTLDSLVISSDQYQLCGNLSVDLNALTSLSAVATSDASLRQVAMVFDKQEVILEPSTGTITLLLPIPAVGDDNHFTIRLSGHYQGTRYVYRRTQTTGGALPRNVIGHVPIVMNLSEEFTNSMELFYRPIATFILGSSYDLKLFAEATRSGWVSPLWNRPYSDLDFILSDNIDMQGDTLDIIPFNGTLNGANHTISNIVVKGITIANLLSSNENILLGGLFYQTNENSIPKIEQLTLNNITIKCQCSSNIEEAAMGGLFAFSQNNEISHCSINNIRYEIAETTSSINLITIGGIAGLNGIGRIENCSVGGIITLPSATSNHTLYIGGLIGREMPITGNSNWNNISSCSIDHTNFPSITSNSWVAYGGLIGYSTSRIISISNCQWNGTININSISGCSHVGGLLGRIAGNSTNNIRGDNSLLSGTISLTSSSAYIGKYIGSLANGDAGALTADHSQLQVVFNGDAVSKTIGNR